MSTPVPVTGLGCSVSFAVGSGSAAALQNPISVSLPNPETKSENYFTTTQTDKFMRKVPVSIDGGKMSISAYYNPADYAAVLSYRGLTNVTCTTITGDTTPVSHSMPVIVVSCSTEMDGQKLTTMKIELEIAGPIS